MFLANCGEVCDAFAALLKAKSPASIMIRFIKLLRLAGRRRKVLIGGIHAAGVGLFAQRKTKGWNHRGLPNRG